VHGSLLPFEQGDYLLSVVMNRTANTMQNLAEENVVLFLHCFNKGHDALQDVAIQIMTDILLTHPTLLTPAAHDADGDIEMETNSLIKPIHKMYSKSLRSADPTVQTTGCTALAKLMLASTIQDPDLLKQMVLAYFDPETQGNPSLRQALTYFLPVYCHSRRQNAVILAKVAVPVLHALAERADDLDEEEEMVGLTLVAAQIADWTDPRKSVSSLQGSVQTDEEEVDGHLVLAEELLEKILAPGCNSKYTSTLDFVSE
jgi:condensin complex subunit 3